MKTAKQSITARFNFKHLRKDNTLQVLFEIRNYTPAPIRVNALLPNLNILHLSKDSLKKGKGIGKDGIVINHYIDKTTSKIYLVLDYLNFFSLPLTKKNIEEHTYYKFSDVLHFAEDVTDSDSAKDYITNYFIKTDAMHQQEQKESNAMYKEALIHSVQKGGEDAYKPSHVMEAIEMFRFENLGTANTKLLPFLKSYCASTGYYDIQISKFNARLFEEIITYVSTEKIARKGTAYYSVNSVKGFIKFIKILFKNLKKEKYSIDADIFDVDLKIGNRKSSNINFNYDESNYVISINKTEFEAIKTGNYNIKLSKVELDLMEKTRKLFLIQTLLGGLRYSEMLLITKESFYEMNNRTYLNLKSSKTKKTIESPMHDELEVLLTAINYDVNSLVTFKHNHSYNTNLRKMGKALGLNRQVAKAVSKVNQTHVEKDVKELHEVICSKYARKALVTLLFYSGKFTLEQIATLTNHSSTSIKNYIAVLLNEKQEMINTL